MIRTETLSKLLIAVLALGFAAGCADEVTGVEDINDLANVDNVEVGVFPSRIEVIATGNLDDACTEISDIDVEQVGDVFTISITTVRPGDAVCAQVLVPFTETIVLDRDGLPAGTYEVVVNGVTEEFVLLV